MNGGRQPQADPPSPTPGVWLIVSQSRNDPLRGSLLQLPHEAAGSLGGLGPWWLDQQMEVLWHEHPADEEEIRLLPKLPPDLDQGAAEAVAVKEFKAAVSTGGDKLPFAGLKMASLDGHEQIYRRNKTKGY